MSSSGVVNQYRTARTTVLVVQRAGAAPGPYETWSGCLSLTLRKNIGRRNSLQFQVGSNLSTWATQICMRHRLDGVRPRHVSLTNCRDCLESAC